MCFRSGTSARRLLGYGKEEAIGENNGVRSLLPAMRKSAGEGHRDGEMTLRSASKRVSIVRASDPAERVAFVRG